MKAILLFALLMPAIMFGQTPLLTFVEANVKYADGQPENYFTSEFQLHETSTKYIVMLEGSEMEFNKSTREVRRFQNLSIARLGDENRMLYLTTDTASKELVFLNFIVAKTETESFNKQYIDWVQWYPRIKEDLTKTR